MADMMHNPIVLPPLMTSPQNGPQRGLMMLESIAQTHHNGQHSANTGWPQQTPAEISTSCPQPSLGHVPASAGSCPADIRAQAAPSPTRAGGKSPDQRSTQGKRMEMKIEQSAAGGDDIITLFPRRKAGQSRPGGGRGPVVLNLELLEQFYGMPLHVAAKRLGICQTAIKKVCRRLGIMKWPYKEMRTPPERAQDKGDDKGEAADNSDAASDETSASLMDTPRVVRNEAPPSAPQMGAMLAVATPRQDDAEVKAAVTALLSLHSV